MAWAVVMNGLREDPQSGSKMYTTRKKETRPTKDDDNLATNGGG